MGVNQLYTSGNLMDRNVRLVTKPGTMLPERARRPETAKNISPYTGYDEERPIFSSFQVAARYLTTEVADNSTVP